MPDDMNAPQHHENMTILDVFRAVELGIISEPPDPDVLHALAPGDRAAVVLELQAQPDSAYTLIKVEASVVGFDGGDALLYLGEVPSLGFEAGSLLHVPPAGIVEVLTTGRMLS